MVTTLHGPRPHRSWRGPVVAVGAVLLLAGSAAGVQAADTAPDEVNAVTRAETIVSPSVVYIQTKWEGYVTSPMLEDADIGWQSVTARSTCTGFVASATGHVVTAGHCVDNESMRYGGKALMIETLLDQYDLSAELTDALRDNIVVNGKVEGLDSGSPPSRTVRVFPTASAAGMTVQRPIVAQVLEFSGLKDGDVALLKVETETATPALEVAPEQPANGTEVVVAGYPGSVTAITDRSATPSFKDGKVSSARTVEGVPYTEISAATSPGMSGGPAVDLDGRVVGTVSWNPASENQQFNFITNTDTLSALLARNGVPAELSPADAAYRAGLEAYWAGDYAAAVESLQETVDALPNHPLAGSYLTKAEKALRDQPAPAPADEGGFPWLLVGGAAVVVVGLTAGALFLLLRRRGSGPVAPASAAATTAPVDPAPAAPVAPVASGAAVVTPTGSGEQPGGFCPHCGTAHAAEAHFCEHCGQPFAHSFTPHEGQWPPATS